MVSAYEIDFLPVGEGERSGDAIAIRWFEPDGQRVLIYDGGTREYGQALVAHVKRHFQTDFVHYIVNSHPDNDHAGGLEYVLDNLRVGEVWMHKPWDYSPSIRHYFDDGRLTDNSLKERLQKKMSAAYAVQKAAERHGVPVYEPFAGSQIGIFTVLSPERDRYIHQLVPEFEKSPALKKEASASPLNSLYKAFDSVQGAIGYIAALWHEEFLPDNVTTSAENESSVILFAKTAMDGILLTGDAGIDSLKAAAEYARVRGVNLADYVTFVQIPHHGGRHNVSTAALDLIVGPALAQQPQDTRKRAYVSVGKEAPRHPKRVVTNAFNRRGFKVVQTKGISLCRYEGVSAREGYAAVTFVPFYHQVEE
ncbi:MBL fold metallo-hydrolase [Herbaspirillum sp. 1130]|uniref:ComEC/Rec2 family competence protein n=1 Tax=Herbaspirillum sp. 1130 TaxID=2806562 RepID=UPI001AE170F0|nr:MBL fold metallo-hydrolase [Herbaspirillum sp. 1130]MBP1313919.1 beta-lactamase superfamily II metal-dependent hydrolase [Herbaspirillum sp. 1130]